MQSVGENVDDHLVYTHTHACACTQVCNSAPLFTRIPFSIDPLCARSGIVWFCLAAGASGIVYKTSGGCHAFQSSSGLLCPGSILHSFPTLVLFARSLSLPSPPPKDSLQLLFALSVSLGSLRLFRSSIDGNPMPDNKGGCMYYLACLSHAYPAVS